MTAGRILMSNACRAFFFPYIVSFLLRAKASRRTSEIRTEDIRVADRPQGKRGAEGLVHGQLGDGPDGRKNGSVRAKPQCSACSCLRTSLNLKEAAGSDAAWRQP